MIYKSIIFFLKSNIKFYYFFIFNILKYMKYITKCDFLSRKANFTFNEEGDIKYKTFIGGIISLFSILCSFGLCTYFLVYFFKREQVLVVLSTETNLFINNSKSSEMPILIRVTDSNSQIYENSEKLYYVTMKIWFGGTNDSDQFGKAVQYTQNISMEKCDINKHFSNYYKTLISEIDNLNSYYCPSIRNYTQTLYGVYGSVYPYSYYTFTIRFCDNSTFNNQCNSLENISTILEESYLDVIYIDYSLDSLRKTDVGIMSLRQERFMISSTMFKRIWLYLENVKYIIDKGYIFTNYIIQIFYRYSSVRFDVDSRNTFKNNYYSTLTILNSRQTSIYNKTYIKLQDLVAILGGIIKAFTMIGTFANYYNALNSYYFKLITDFMLENGYDKSYKKYRNTSNISIIKIRNQLSGIKQNTKITNTKKQNILNLGPRIDKKEFVKRRISSSILPISISSKKLKYKYELLMLIEELNKRLNIITVLKKLETIHLIFDPLNQSYINLSKINQSKIESKINNYIQNDASSSGNNKILGS